MTEGRSDMPGDAVASLGPDAPDTAAAEDCRAVIKPRVIQYQGKRYGIRLEDTFWEVLEKEAASRGCRLNELVHEHYCSPQAVGNKTAYLRECAVVFLSRQLDAARSQIELDSAQASNILRMTQRPALLVDSGLCVARTNRPFDRWITPYRTDPDVATRISFRASRRVIQEKLAETGGLLRGEQGAVLIPGRAFPLAFDITQLSEGSTGSAFLAVFSKAVES